MLLNGRRRSSHEAAHRRVAKHNKLHTQFFFFVHLAVSGGQRDLQARADDDHDGRAELDAEPPRRGNLGDLHPDGRDNLVAVQHETEHDADTSETEDPVTVATELAGRVDGACDCLLYTSPSPRD